MSQASDYAANASRILEAKGNAIAQGHLARGAALGNTIATLGQVIPQQVQAVMKRNAEKRRDDQLKAIFQKHNGDLGSAINDIMGVDPVLGSQLMDKYGQAAKTAAEIQKLHMDATTAQRQRLFGILSNATNQEEYSQGFLVAKLAGIDVPPELPREFDPQFMAALKQSQLKPEEDFTLVPGAKRFSGSGSLRAENPYQLTPDQQADNARATAAEERAGRAETRAEAAQAEAARHNRVMEARTPAGDQTLVAIVGPDGQPVLVPRSQAVGKKPAGGAGGANRKMTSGDANRIADYDTSLNDLNVLERDIGKTGTGSAVGAALPNAVTNLTGWGADSKARQAVIDRVKQVIGKALEGGVLRKEDEYKYVKILPVIGDAPSVAASKIKGLRAAIGQRRETLLDSLTDAGYDTSGYGARQQSAPTSTPKPAGKIGPYSFQVE